jgi:hypothetical protein
MFQAGPVNSPSSGCSQNAQTRKPAISASEFARETLVNEADGADIDAFEEEQLIRRLNGLLKALSEFGASYNAGMFDAKKVKAVRKALHELEKSKLFKPGSRN